MEKTIEKAKCPDCFGDGHETCHNPDHGFLSGIMSIKGVNESACPCCGHNEDHKMTNYNMKTGRREYKKCETCKGIGRVAIEKYNEYLDEFVSSEDVEELNEHCLDS